jgi:hypothetical protein
MKDGCERSRYHLYIGRSNRNSTAVNDSGGSRLVRWVVKVGISCLISGKRERCERPASLM